MPTGCDAPLWEPQVSSIDFYILVSYDWTLWIAQSFGIHRGPLAADPPTETWTLVFRIRVLNGHHYAVKRDKCEKKNHNISYHKRHLVSLITTYCAVRSIMHTIFFYSTEWIITQRSITMKTSLQCIRIQTNQWADTFWTIAISLY